MLGSVIVSFQEPHKIQRVLSSESIGHNLSDLVGQSMLIFVGLSTDWELFCSSIQNCNVMSTAVAQLVLYNLEGKGFKVIAKFSRMYDNHLRSTACKIDIASSEAMSLDEVPSLFGANNATALVCSEFPNIIVSTNVMFNNLFSCIPAAGKPFHVLSNMLSEHASLLEGPKNGQVLEGMVEIRLLPNQIIRKHFSSYPVVNNVNDTIQYIAVSFSFKPIRFPKIDGQLSANEHYGEHSTNFRTKKSCETSKIIDDGRILGIHEDGPAVMVKVSHAKAGQPNSTLPQDPQPVQAGAFTHITCASDAPTARPEISPPATASRGRRGKRQNSPGFEQVRRIYRKLRRAELRSMANADASEGGRGGGCGNCAAIEAWDTEGDPPAAAAANDPAPPSQGCSHGSGWGDSFDVEGTLDLLSVEWARRA